MTTEERPDSRQQPPLTRRESALRYGLIITFGVLSLIADGPGATLSMLAVEVGVGLLALVLVVFRRRWPTTVGVLTNASTAFSLLAFPSAMLATMSVSTRRRWREIVPVAIALIVATVTHGGVVTLETTENGVPTSQNWADVAVSVVLLVLFVGFQIAWGMYIGSRRQLLHALQQRAERLEQEQEMRAQHARDAERAQIAREMHDVLAHRISQVSMQAGAIAFRTDLDADALRRAAVALQASANAALVDLRGVLGVLRDPESGATVDVPQPRFSDIDTLIDHGRSSGLRIDSDIEVEDAAAVDDTIGRTLYRVTQECLTNARKHAPNATVTIRITGSPESGIAFRSANPLPVARLGRPLPASGYGLIGLSERAALVGGTLTTSASATEFVVTCHLPWRPLTDAAPTDDARPANR